MVGNEFLFFSIGESYPLLANIGTSKGLEVEK